MKTYMANEQTVQRNWYIVDAKDMALGRVAAQVAAVLRGKNKPEFTPHCDCGDYVIVINSDHAVLTGKKMEQKYRRYHTGYMSGLKEIQYKKLMAEKSDEALYLAVKGMMPKNSLGRRMLKKLRVYKGAEHPHVAQQAKELKLVEKKYN
ncbi:MAG: 50S ribosomal protein L13 [Firmicutes bacterium]|nr:50S ribosomal protein L13 [Bacillota bacterium]